MHVLWSSKYLYNTLQLIRVIPLGLNTGYKLARKFYMNFEGAIQNMTVDFQSNCLDIGLSAIGVYTKPNR